MLPPNRNLRLLPMVIATGLAFLLLDAVGFGPITAARRTVLSVGEPIGTVLAIAASPVTATWNGAVHYDDVVEENDLLRRRVAELEGAAAGRGDVEADLRSLLIATDIDYLGDVERVTARVVGDRRTEIERVVEIDKGSEAGIREGMPVVTGHGLAGTIELVAGGRSVVRLISDPQLEVGVRSRHGLGLAVGRRDGRLDLLATPELAESLRLGAIGGNERFVTSGVDRSIYPPGIPVGTLVGDVATGSGLGRGDAVAAGGPPAPAGPRTAAADEADQAAPVPRASSGSVAGGQFLLAPLVDLDRLAYLTVLLVQPSP